MGPECMGHLTDVCDCELNLSAAEMKLATGTYTSGLGTQRLESKTVEAVWSQEANERGCFGSCVTVRMHSLEDPLLQI